MGGRVKCGFYFYLAGNGNFFALFATFPLAICLINYFLLLIVLGFCYGWIKTIFKRKNKMTLENNLELPEPFKSMPYSEGLPAFIECFVKEYTRQNKSVEKLYTDNIGKEATDELTDERIDALFIWKNGSKISKLKTKSIEDNYKKEPTPPDWEARYLDHKQKGGQIWNIFYLHIVFPDKYPIFDQHVYRSMCFMQKEKNPKELTLYNGEGKISEYNNKYRDFHACIKKIVGDENRKIDKALHAFGKDLKKQARLKLKKSMKY